MSQNAPYMQGSHLRLLDGSPNREQLDLVSELFHRINRVIPDSQVLLTVPPRTTVREAIGLMRRHGYSQLPVVDGGEVLGVFSYRSFAHSAALREWTDQTLAPGDLYVDEFLEQFQFARVTSEMHPLFPALDRHNGVLVGTEDNCLNILTQADFIKYLHRVSSPFVLIAEIELALVKLIRLAVTDTELAACIERERQKSNNPKKYPSSLDRMSFGNLEYLIANEDNWPFFAPALGAVSRARTIAKLKEVRELRNAAFHFDREIHDSDIETLSLHRDWIMAKVKQAGVRLRSSDNDR